MIRRPDFDPVRRERNYLLLSLEIFWVVDDHSE